MSDKNIKLAVISICYNFRDSHKKLVRKIIKKDFTVSDEDKESVDFLALKMLAHKKNFLVEIQKDIALLEEYLK